MKRTFDIRLVDGHLLISDNGNTILVDTGSPVTVHQEDTLNFLTDEEAGMEGTIVPLVNVMGGVKAICLEINDQPLKMAIDTGASLSYVDRMVTDDFEAIGEKEDFHHMAGRYTTPIFKLEAEFCGKRFSGTYGNLPTMMGLSLKLGGLDGVVGYDFFKSFKVMFDFRDSLMVIN